MLKDEISNEFKRFKNKYDEQINLTVEKHIKSKNKIHLQEEKINELAKNLENTKDSYK